MSYKLPFNLLITFEVLMSERSVSRAAKRLGITQSTLSESLRNLRVVLNDDLFIRDHYRLVPTARALEIIEPVRKVIFDTKQILASGTEFDPETSERTFTIGMSSYVEFMLYESLLAQLSRVAPGVKIFVKNITNVSDLYLLDSGKIDLVIGAFGAAGKIDISQVYQYDVIAKDRVNMCIGDVENTIFSRKIDIETYSRAEHVNIEEKDLLGFCCQIDELLRKQGHSRNICACTPFFSTLPFLLLGSKRIATVSHSIAEKLTTHFALKSRIAPVAANYTFALIWHRHNRRDSANVWLRNLVSSITSSTKK